MKAYLPNDIKDQNRKVIYDILLNNPPIAKVEISEMTTMSLVTVGKIIDYFEEINLLVQSDENREGARGLGRKRILYEFNPNIYLSIGIQIIGGNVSAVLINLKSEVLDTYVLEGKIDFNKESLKEAILNIKKYFEQSALVYNSKFLGIGLAVDGAIKTSQEKIRMKINHKEEIEFSYRDIINSIENALDLPIFLENDVNASVLCEHSRLDIAEVESDNILEIALDNGIGAGMILDKKLYRGNKNGVGELEYMCFDLDYVAKPTSVGWLEKKLNSRYLEEKFDLDFRDIEKAKTENINACIDYVSKYIALTICNAISLLDISNVVLSGPIFKALEGKLLERIEQDIFNYTGWKLNIYISYIEYSSAIGAGLLSIENEISRILFG